MARGQFPLGVVAGLAGLWGLLRLFLIAAGGVPGQGVALQVGEARVTAIHLIASDGGERAPRLLVAAHGGLASKETLLGACWEARRRGADCLAVDLLGHGGASAIPGSRVVEEMHRALRVDRVLGGYREVRFVGHSLGAALGCGGAFPCQASVAIGNRAPCAESRIVWGDVHRALGLPAPFYALSHVLEPWTPGVLDQAVTRVLGPAPAVDAPAPGGGGLARLGAGLHRLLGGPIAATVAVAWASFVVMMVLGVVVAGWVRRAVEAPPWARGLLAAAAVYAALAVGAWRALWFLIPTQGSDVVIVGLCSAGAIGVARGLRTLGVRAPGWGVLLGVVLGQALGICGWWLFPRRELAGIVMMMPMLHAPLAITVAVWERASRARGACVVESATFATALLATFQALLLPAW
ncbi:alpha/beta hydrolase [Chondromyces apiculatus]|uniref:Uncharacterized protein n=1 Tax=Chondromyces apiculatus DSM 436 TaxID=1192034 RepID=A0A017TAA5_9BACT|nr:alpha/beta hydrolase [Chondromyces apiculatus]EYF06154.1 Hypothetical protein CAP_2344 [Chondromyces apiculatus DSM 436]